MIRPVTCICMLLAGASGLYLYQSKHRAQLLDREILRTIRATAQTRERIGMLRAEWALLNEPDRLAELSQQHLALRTLSPQQFVPVAELASRLPVQAAPAPAADEDAPPPAVAAAPTPSPASAPAPAPSRPAPPSVARPAPAPAPPPSQLAARAPTPAPAREAPVRQASPEPVWQPAPGGGYQLVTPAAPRPLAPIVPAYATPMAAPPPSRSPMVQRVAAPSEPDYGSRQAPAPFVGSALGGSRPALAAPVPVAR